MSRLNIERRQKIEPNRIQNAIDEINALGYNVEFVDGNMLKFEFNGSIIRFWPYTGWHSGKTIRDGRGFMNLYNQIK